MQGIQQHPQVTSIDTKTTRDIKRDITRFFHIPNALENQSVSGLLTPESSAMLSDRALRPFKARVTTRPGRYCWELNCNIVPQTCCIPLLSRLAAYPGLNGSGMPLERWQLAVHATPQ